MLDKLMEFIQSKLKNNIVEFGEVNGWRYEKFGNGNVKMYRKFNIEGVKNGDILGFNFISGNLPTLPFKLTNIDGINATGATGSGLGFVAGVSIGSDSAPRIHIMSSQASTNLIGYIEIIGRLGGGQ